MIDDPTPSPEPTPDPEPDPTPDPEPSPDPEPAPDPDPEDVEIVDDWRDLIVNEDLRKQADKFNSPEELITSVNDLQKMVSDRVQIPGKDADEKELAKFRKAVGVPSEADDYKVEAPEGMTFSDEDTAFIDILKPIAHKHNIPNSAFNEFAREFKDLETQALNEQNADLQKQFDASVDDLKKEWGKDFDANVNIANRGMKELGGDELVGFLNETKTDTGELLANHPHLVRAFASLGRKMSEDGVITPVDRNEAKDLETRIDELTNEANEALYLGDRQKADKLFGERNELSERLYGDAPVVGSENRTL